MQKTIVLFVLAIFVSLCGFSGVVYADLNDGLVAYYPFNGNANDESGNGNDGVVSGATLIEDRFGNADSAYSFDGSDDFISVTDGSQFNMDDDTISLFLWVRPENIQTDFAVILDKSHHLRTYGYPKGWVLQQVEDNTNPQYFAFGNGSEWSKTGYGDTDGASLDVNEWNSLAVIKDDTTIKYYLNGELRLTEEVSISNMASNTDLPLYIGALNGVALGSSRFFNGQIDDIRVYNRVLSESEIQELYREGESNNDTNEDYEAGRQSCIDDPESCGLRPGKAAFTGELAEKVQSYLVLTENSVPFNLPPGSYVQAYGSNGMNTLNVEEYARLQCQNFVDENEINIEEVSSAFTVYRSGATVYLNSTSGTLIEIPATETSQTLRFADGSLELVISGGNVMLGNQIVDQTESAVESDVNDSDTSGSIF